MLRECDFFTFSLGKSEESEKSVAQEVRQKSDISDRRSNG